MKKRQERIAEEIKRLADHPWAGDYFAGDGTGVNQSLTLAPQAGFVFEWHGCGGLYDRNYGTTEVVDGNIRFSFAFENVMEGFRGLEAPLIPVAWGERKYLVARADFIDFCNAINDGTEPRRTLYGRYLLRRRDEKKAVHGPPTIPAEFKPYLLAKPVAAKVTAVGESHTRPLPSLEEYKTRETVVTINAGKQHGLLKGMELRVVKPDDVFQEVTITEVGEADSKGMVKQTFSEDRDAPPPRIGWQLSTRSPWASAREE